MKEHINSQGYPPNEKPNVYYVVLTSCDSYGRPEFPVSFFDGATKRSFKKHDIQVITVHDLVMDFKQSYPNWDGDSELFQRSSETNHDENQRLKKIFEDSCKVVLADKMDTAVFKRTMDQNRINAENSMHELVKRLKNPNYELSPLDVYIMLFHFIKKHRKDHIFVDEFSIFHSRFCKLHYFT